MPRIVEGNSRNLQDVEAFLRALEALGQHPDPNARELFTPGAELIIARAPGRLDVMGGIADYSGSLVLQLPTAEAVLAALEVAGDRSLQFVSLAANQKKTATRKFEMRLEEFERAGVPIEYSDARAIFARRREDHWAAYVAGTFLVLMREHGVRFRHGARILIDSQVPEGKGVSSSAALEVAVMCAVLASINLKLDAREIALLCQKVENLVVGAPCGVMDQITSACGQKDRLLALLCQPADILGFVPIPSGIVIAGIDSGVRHAVTGAAYGDVRVGAFIGYRLIAGALGFSAHVSSTKGLVNVDDPRWKGYLANISPSEFDQHFASHLPESINGQDFLERYSGTTDPVLRVNPKSTYAVRAPAAHPVYENFRVRVFAELFEGKINESSLRLLGELMYQSHASYGNCKLGEPRTDRLVDLCRTVGSKGGAYGAKITGGGSGGTVAILGAGEHDAVQTIADSYARETGYEPYIFKGSSPGAVEFGTLRLKAIG